MLKYSRIKSQFRLKAFSVAVVMFMFCLKMINRDIRHEAEASLNVGYGSVMDHWISLIPTSS